MTRPAWWYAREEAAERNMTNYLWSLQRLLDERSIPWLEQELARIASIKRITADRKCSLIRGLYKWYIEYKMP